MSGYKGRVIKVDLADFTGDPAADPMWVVIKNPLMVPDRLTKASNADTIETTDDGTILPGSRKAATAGIKEVICRLIVAWRVYDATAEPQVDPSTGEEIPGTAQMLLPLPAGGNGVPVDDFEKLPSGIQVRLFQAYGEAANPQKGQDGTTPKTSSGQPNPSSTAPGAAAPSPPN